MRMPTAILNLSFGRESRLYALFLVLRRWRVAFLLGWELLAAVGAGGSDLRAVADAAVGVVPPTEDGTVNPWRRYEPLGRVPSGRVDRRRLVRRLCRRHLDRYSKLLRSSAF